MVQVISHVVLVVKAKFGGTFLSLHLQRLENICPNPKHHTYTRGCESCLENNVEFFCWLVEKYLHTGEKSRTTSYAKFYYIDFIRHRTLQQVIFLSRNLCRSTEKQTIYITQKVQIILILFNVLTFIDKLLALILQHNSTYLQLHHNLQVPLHV